MTVDQIIVLARKHLGSGEMESSARLCLADAVALHDAGWLDEARFRATKSIAYSVGILHPDYKRAVGPIVPYVEIDTITEYGLTQRLSRSIRVF